MSSTVSESTVIEPSLKFQAILSVEALKKLNQRSTLRGVLQLATHGLILGISGYVWGANLGQNWVIALPALVIYGFSIAVMFAPLHECSHRTAFTHHALNDAVCWLAGVLSFYNSAFFRRYHKWHHRYAQDAERDPELSDPVPQTLRDYLVTISGLPWWWGKVKTHTCVAFGRLDSYPFIPENARSEVMWSTRWQLAVYAGAIATSCVAHQPWFITYWLLPLGVGQPILRFILLAEHTGCSHDRNPLTNTRSTRTLLPLQWLMWNMPFHAEHHLYPSIPFYQLPAAHQQLRKYFVYKDQGYVEVNRSIVADLHAASV
jgi:fatty acid desaturase